jgi:hypothetical protein
VRRRPGCALPVAGGPTGHRRTHRPNGIPDVNARTEKDSGLAQPTADAINFLIENGQYAKWLQAWGLQNEAVPTSEVNPPGLPITNA